MVGRLDGWMRPVRAVSPAEALPALVVQAGELAHEARRHGSDPLIQAAAEAIEAADILLRLWAPTAPVSPADRVQRLSQALESVRAASVAVRFAIVETGDHDRRTRARGAGSGESSGDRAAA